MLAFRESTIQLQRDQFEIQVPTPDGISLINELQNELPSLTVNIRPVYKELEGVEGVFVPTNPISIVGIRLYYRDCTDVKKRITKLVSVKGCNLTFNNSIMLVQSTRLSPFGGPW